MVCLILMTVLGPFIACSNVWTALNFKITHWAHALFELSHVIHALHDTATDETIDEMK
jgi:hypothetical protein